MYIMLYMFGYMVGAWFYCIEVCYNIMYLNNLVGGHMLST